MLTALILLGIVPPSSAIIGNEYVDLSLNSNGNIHIKTGLTGHPDISGDENIRLLFGGTTSFTTIRIKNNNQTTTLKFAADGPAVIDDANKIAESTMTINDIPTQSQVEVIQRIIVFSIENTIKD